MDTRREMMGGVLSSSKLIDNYLTIEALEDGLFASLSFNACEYCIDGDGNWRSLPMDTTTETINTGQTLSFRGEITPTSSGIGSFSINKKFNLLGNCMSLLFGDNAANNFSLEGKGSTFYALFSTCKVVEVSDNFLPATILSPDCYREMFDSCDYLIKTPFLPATTLAEDCYINMFSYCTNLTTAPELPATTLASGCYSSMFSNCTSLTTAPELPATTLAYDCYSYMFYGCTKLNYIKMLATDISATNCLTHWVNGVASSGTFVKNPAMITLPNAILYNDYAGAPSGWTVLNA